MGAAANGNDKNQLEELLQQYEQLQQGGVQSFLEEEAFERISE